jgi:hypothetical protein
MFHQRSFQKIGINHHARDVMLPEPIAHAPSALLSTKGEWIEQ